jgi:hypothetical protein
MALGIGREGNRWPVTVCRLTYKTRAVKGKGKGKRKGKTKEAKVKVKEKREVD